MVAKRGGSSASVAALQADVPAVLKAAARQLRDKSPKTRAAIFRVLKELVSVQPDATAASIDQLTPGIAAALEVQRWTKCSPSSRWPVPSSLGLSCDELRCIALHANEIER